MRETDLPLGYRLVYQLLIMGHRFVRGLANRLLPRAFIRPREFSNALIRQYGAVLSGSVINVSGWNDGDREGGTYQSYFPQHTSYTVSNYEVRDRGMGSMHGTGITEISLDLNQPIRKDLEGAYDVVFNHTTLEHVVHVEQAFANLCALSRDAVVLVVPVMQQFHILPSYGDYFRVLPFAIVKQFELHGFTPLVVRTNEQPFAPIYCVALAVRDPKKYEGKITSDIELNVGQHLYGSSAKKQELSALLNSAPQYPMT